MRIDPRSVPLLASLALLLATPAPAQQADDTQGVTIVGRAFDVQSREPIEGLTVTIPGTDHAGITNASGLFRLPGVARMPSAVLRFEHVAYGTQSDTVAVGAGRQTMLRISLAKTAIDIDPLVIRVASEAARRERAAGSSLKIISEAEIARLAPGTRGVEGILDREIPGIRVSNRGNIPGTNICVEFRGVAKSLQDTGPCLYPLMIVDQIRIDDPIQIEAVVSTLEIGDIHQIEMIPPAAAGVQYGTGSQYGVLVIETKLRGGPAALGSSPSAVPAELRPPSTYNWALEPEGHPTWRTLGATTLGNAAGLALGLWIANRCIDFEQLHMDFFNSSCGSFGTGASRLGALAFPILGNTLGAHLAGRTALSEGEWTSTAAMGLMTLVPGYILAGTSLGQKSSTPEIAGKVMLAVGVPIVTTLADKLFREIRTHDRP